MKRKFVGGRGRTPYQKPWKVTGIQTAVFWLAHDPLVALKKIEGGRNRPGRARGRLTGYREKDLVRLRKIADKEAKRIYRHMTEKKMFAADNNVAEEALTEVISILRQPGHPKDKLAAAKTLLEYTQRKPVASSEVTLNQAETFLEAVLDDMAETKEPTDGSETS